jgi:PIN domain nuclease of toxin-antitoxin system
VIVIDTHIWIWWVHDAPQLTSRYKETLAKQGSDSVGVSIISCWEVAKLVEGKKLSLPTDVSDWIRRALEYPEIALLRLTPEIAIESTQLPGTFHRGPADQLIVATARVYDIPLMTMDQKILAYPDVKLVP